MQTCWSRTKSAEWLRPFVLVAILGSPVSAAEIRLKNGTIVRGDLLVMNSMASPAVGKSAMTNVVDADPVPHLIARMDTGWQRIYFPVQQDSKQPQPLVGATPFTIPLPTPKRQSRTLTVTSFGAITFAEPFDEFGRRRVTINNQNKPMNVLQSITKAMPDHVQVESTNCEWKLGMALKSIPIDSLEKMLRRQIDQKDASSRFGLVRFYIQAEYFLQASNELEAIARDFPERKELVEKTQADLMNFFGAEILRHLGRRKRAGQHVLAETFANKLLTQSLSGSVLQDVHQYVRTYEQARLSIDRVKLLLGEWQAKLSDREKEKLVQPLRSEVDEQLDFETLPRMDAFLKAEADNLFEPSQRLGLAYSGWLLGPANATPDLDQALRVWEARKIVLEYLRSDDPSFDIELIKKLQSIENISPPTVLSLTGQLPPINDSSDVVPGKPHRVETHADAQTNYWVTLPAEYSPHHNYPLIVTLRPAHRTAEETAAAWAGDPNDADLGINRGYIVIAPEYAEKNAPEYSFGASAHKYVLDCLIDARKRFAVDSDRVFLAGHGMGADAAYDIGMAQPDEFAGVMPLGGNAINYCFYTYENGSYTSWYAFGKGYDSNGTRDPVSNPVFDRIMKKGFKYDFLLVEYLGRNGENAIDEIPKLFEWMDLHVRQPQQKQFKVCSLRKTDNRFFWVTAGGLPRDYILPLPTGEARKVSPMEIDVRVTSPGNTIFLKSPTENYSLRLTPELVDFEKRLLVRVNDRQVFNNFVKPDTSAVLEELRSRGDRKRLPLAVLTPENLRKQGKE